jgi:hypothetical protein
MSPAPAREMANFCTNPNVASAWRPSTLGVGKKAWLHQGWSVIDEVGSTL